MEEMPPDQHSKDLMEKAERAKKIIYLCMAIFMVLPFVLAWATGALRF